MDAPTTTNLRDVARCPQCGAPAIRVPVLACGRCKVEHPLRAFAYRRNDKHIAECIDLDLLTQGDTVEEAIGKLQEAMYGYLQVAFVPGESTKGLVLRHSPLSHRLRYWLHDLRCRLSSHRGMHFFLPKSDIPGLRGVAHC